MTINTVLTKYRDYSFSEHDKGTRFERLMQAWLRTDPLYKDRFSDVWLWNEFPGRKDFGGKDTGIDLVAKTHEGDWWAVQCKCYAESASIDKPAVDSFLSTSGRSFENENFQTTFFSNRLWIATTNRWGSNAEETIHNQQPPVTRVSLATLESSPVDWAALENGVHGEQARTAKKTLREHQKTALDSCYEHFEHADRGRMIMACGTGKTFTSLKIAEHETNGSGLILFLVPSIALLGQTLREWSAEATGTLNSICVCSDTSVGKKRSKAEDSDSFSVEDLALPASTKPEIIANQIKNFLTRSAKTVVSTTSTSATSSAASGLTVVFSTYQSIQAVSEAQYILNKSNPGFADFDLIVCDEAHRTTGVTLKDEDESHFVRVHDNSFIVAKKRLYMTATPRLFSDDTKAKAQEEEVYLCSMDDPALYGEEFYRIGFGEAVNRNLLSDYKVLVLTLTDDQIPPALQAAIADGTQEINTDDASKLIGCINALSKRMLVDAEMLSEADPEPMRRAVAFCQNIKISKKTTSVFNTQKDVYYGSLSQEERAGLVTIEADHVDGTMGASKRDEKLSWLKSVPAQAQDCRILCNVRCLSEGVDVPSLDAVLFLSARNSQIDVVQSVGRVMRVSPGKKYGYIIIPVVIPANVSAEQALDDNERFRVVWTVLNALRAHDDRFNAMINKLELNKKKPNGRSAGGNVLVGGIPDKPWNPLEGPALENPFAPRPGLGSGSAPTIGPDGKQTFSDAFQQEFAFKFEQLQSVIYARMVKKVGSKQYWEQWATSVADIARRHIDRITRLIATPGKHQNAFELFLADLKTNINPSVSDSEAIEMLAQHIITKPVFEALFENYSFVKDNPVSRAMQRMVDLLEEESLAKDQEALEKFYDSVRLRASGIDNAEARQRIIVELYDKFFRTAFPHVVEKLGIVYTPVEVVDFIINSVASVLHTEFGRTLSDENVHILDPFTGTGTFITRLLQSGHIAPADLMRKYRHELHANEIVLLAYYIASINIENVYHDLVGGSIPPEESQGLSSPPSAGESPATPPISPPPFEPFPGICLTDTFQLFESSDSLLTQLFPENSTRIDTQRKAPIRIIMGNPPYSVGQKSANDNAQNQSYKKLESRIEETYVRGTSAVNKNSLYDSYIKAFRWASDRLDPENGGIVAFVSNAGWLDGSAMDGFRTCLENEFSAIWVFNLRGNQRTSGELSRKEGGKIFGGGSRTPITITLLVKKPGSTGKARIHYHDIGDYLSREEKLTEISAFASVSNPAMEWTTLEPNDHGDWLNQRDDQFGSYIALGDKSDKSAKTFFVPFYSRGVATARDPWCYNSSREKLIVNIYKTIDFYNSERSRIVSLKEKNNDININELLNYDSTKGNWNRSLKGHLEKNTSIMFQNNSVVTAQYRPFCKQILYFDCFLNDMTYQIPKLFPTPEQQNRVICVPGLGGGKDFSSLMTDCIPDLNSMEAGAQCFPLYWYEKIDLEQGGLFDEERTRYVRRDGVSDFILVLARQKYGPRVTKEDIFYYVYGFLHGTEYRSRYSADLKKMLPRLPLVEKTADFWAFSQAGKTLSELHINYETLEPYPLTEKGNTTNLKIDKMRFPSKTDKTAIIYNSNLTLTGIPDRAHEYIVNGKSALEWILDRYQITTHKESRIKNDPNDWCTEQANPRYIVDLIKRIIALSLKTLDIIDTLPQWHPETKKHPDYIIPTETYGIAADKEP